jgi:hypothetical protein
MRVDPSASLMGNENNGRSLHEPDDHPFEAEAMKFIFFGVVETRRNVRQKNRGNDEAALFRCQHEAPTSSAPKTIAFSRS